MELLQFTCLLLLISLKCLTGFGQQCGGNQWQCDDGACLPLSWHCDGNGDCMDGSDEMACPCPRGQVACMAGAPGCVNTSAVCDGLRQCSDGSDEFNCPENQGCLQGDWRCRNKICIPKDLYCNGANDCVDNSDEACGRCGPMAVRCPGGACLTEDERCDGKLQCSDGSDEPSTCGRTCSEENGGCSHSCVDQPWGALCSCPKGYRLSANGASCLDVDECALPYGPCMHFCVNTPGSFYCHCRDGFQLQGTTYCYAKGNYTKFLTAKKGTIGFLNLKTLRFESIQSIGYDPLALAFDLSRSSFYWADDQGNIYKAKEQQRRILYHGQYGVRSLVCDWLTGQLYWTNQKTRSIHVGAADGSGFATVLAKNIDPLELVLLPIESLLFWINKGPGDKITLERSGMDGIKQESLVVLTAQAPRSLTLDVTARRLYWMSDFKKSIETVRVDGNGRYSFLEFFKRRPAQSLAVFERWFYWTDQMGLWRSPQDRPNQKTFIQRTTLPVLEAYHEQQQPKAPSACVKSGCQLCMLTLDLPAGFTCTCPDDKLLMADGSCEYPRFAYATSTTLNLFELKGKELIKTKLLTTDDVMESFDIDWRGDWVYWANSTGHVMRWNLNTSQTETVPTLRPACVVAVDQKMRNLYWLSCDEACVGVTNMDQGYPRRLYQSGSEVRDVYLDWQRGRLYLLEAGWILSMRLPGGNPRKVLRVEGHVAGRIVLDLQSNTLLWNTEGDDLKIMSLLKSQTHLVGREWNIPGSIVAAHSPLLVSLFNDVITVWDRRDKRRVHDVPVGPGVVRVIVALDVKEVPPAQPVCTSPSVMCRGSTLCISQTQLCDTFRDCPDGFDEESCITKCPNRGEFRCKDRRKCIKRSLVCDGRAHCHDGSDEIGCPTIAAPTSQTAALKCRMGSRLCKDGRECVLHSHVCDGEVDCKDGSDEQDCGESPVPLTTAYLAPTTTVPDILPAQPVCTSPSVMCRGSTLCISQTQLCDTLRDCPDGFDEESCITKCPNRGEFRCKDRRKCIKRSLVCDGRAHCHDGSDEIGCPTIAAPTSQTAALKCRMGSRLCKDGRECVLHSHVCDGEVDCKDGSDEQDCGESPVPLTTAYLAPTTTVPDILPAQPVCTSPSVMCRGSTLCISQTQLCDTLRDCPDGFDEESCITKCPNRGEFRCKDRRKCIKRSLVCDGRAHCHDGSDEIGCPTIAAPTSQTAALKCRMGSRLCKDGRECVLHSHVCDGEVDCKDGSDEQDCELLCKAGQFQCAHGKKCIDQQQMCDGKAQCQDRSDEMDCFKPTKSCSHRCDNNSRCIPETFLCDGERDCSDGSDEEDCVAKLCGQQQYHCSNGQCVSEALRCDGHADCGDHSDEVGCAKPPHCPPERRCPNSHECLVEEWLCDGEQDCQDGSDEMNCKVSPVTCGEFQWSCVSKTQCIPATWRCDGQKDCEDYSDEAGCDQLKCSNQLYQCGSGECVDHSLLCDHIINCPDGSDEGHGCSTNNCSSPGTPQCDQHCVSTPYGPRCICAAGFRLQANGLSCVDVDECNEVLPPVCSHICLNTRSSFLCRCHHGYLLEPNGHSCKTQDEAHLLASVQNELLVLGLHSSSLSLLSTSQTPVFCVDYDWRDQRVYWVSLEEESIKWTSINTKETGTLVKGVKSDSIAVDWVGRNLYWLDGLASQILAVRLGTSTVKSQNYIVVLDEDLEQPRSLLLLPHKGLMYWSEVGSDPQIERSGMDGSERKVVLTRGLSRPVSLSVDTLTDRIYWADEKLQCIGSVSLEGHNVRLLQLTEMPSPFSVMVFNDMVYWSDTKRRTIQVSHKNTGKNRKVLLKRPGQPFGIRIMHPLRQSNVSSPCEKLQCSHICLLAPGLSTGPRTGSTGPKAVCRCAAGLLLAGDGLTCSTLVDTTFLLLLSPTAVTQIYLSTIHNGVGLKRLPEHHIWSLPWAHQASGLDLAVQERNLYLADAAQGSVDLLKLSSSGLTPDIRVLNLQDDTVMAMAVDWVTLNLYWSSRKQPDLHVTTTRGQHTAPLLQLGLQGTTSIALHPPSGRLCFTALGQVNVRSLPQVACAFMDGRSQKLLWRKAVMPTSLLFSSKGTRLYWADIGAGVIDSILLDGSGYKQFKADPGLMSFTLAENVLLWSSLDKDVTRIWFSDGFQPKQLWFEVNTNVVALRVYSKTSQKGTNSCSERNGGCSQLCLAYPGGRSCRCGRGYQPVDTKTCSPFPPLQCPEGSRACSDGSRCLPLTKFCNHQTDCLDHSDEIKCWSGVKPQDVSHSKPSPGHAGNTVPPSQDWSGRTTPGGVDVQKLDSESCDAQQCNGHGKCVARGGETTCQCVLGYHGVFCEEGEGPGVSNAPLTLGILSLIGGVLIAAVIIRKSRARAAARGQSTDKETLMTNMDEQTVYAVSFNNDLYDPDQELISSADGTSQHL
ncbi:low-density lipoprotein receptor-related protein 2-like isoform X37 [Oncorhynchus keta]|uniref:low-density lipoprotein receptor-related protein 2-like isoform X37 n=1 Tax=Oncorhynchus keta TaxID=8018 RepID=UPI00227A8235|nr:low-density lipoprotein receptor-related protein 2-like isoform X37 [Oncorhynchus keta]